MYRVALLFARCFLYILAISRMKDIQRVFAYHGAEHKVIFAYEDRESLTDDNRLEMSAAALKRAGEAARKPS